MKTKILLGVAVIFIIGLAVGVYWWLNRPQIITFSDDSKLTLLGADYGKHHVVPGGRIPRSAARPAAAAGGAARRAGNSSFNTPDDALVVWVRAKYDYTPNQPNQPNQPAVAFQPSQYHNFQIYVYDKAGTACAGAPSRNVTGQRGDDILAIQFDAFPRREGKLVLRAQEQNNNGQEMADNKFVVSNPAAKKSFEKWTPDPLPSTKEEDGLAVTLTKLVAGADMQYRRNQDDPDDAMNKGVQVAYHVERAGKRVTNWDPASVETTDATGNRTAMNFGLNGNQVQWNGDEGTFNYQYGLWPDEPAWKLRLELTQTADFSSDEEWPVQNIPVVPGSPQSFNGLLGARGGVAVRGGVVVRTNPGNPTDTPAPFAEADLGGHHIKIFPVVQFTNQPVRPANLPANVVFAQPQQQTMLMIQVQPAVIMMRPMIRPGNVAMVNAMQPADDGMRMTLAKVTDGQGNEITAMNNGTSTTAPGGANSTSTFRFNLRDIAGVTNINATIALHKNRFLEFTVKPEKAATAQP